MSEMDKFRAILKKNNIEHSNDGSDVYIRGDGHSYHVWPIVNSYLCESIFYITAEQAASIIDSFRMCSVESITLMDGEYVPQSYYEYKMECGECFKWDDEEPPRYCPNCGRKVKK